MIGKRVDCPQCQARVSAKARWCPDCGAELAAPVPEKPSLEKPVLEKPATDSAADAAAEAAPDAAPEAAPTSVLAAKRTTTLLAGALVLVLIGVGLVFGLGHPASDTTVASGGQQTSARTRAALLLRATAATTQAFTYTATSLDKDMAASAALMTPTMAKRYLTELTAAARRQIVSRGEAHTAKVPLADGVSSAAVTSMSDNSAQVLVLMVVTTTIKGSKAHLVTPYRIHVTLMKSGDAWLIDNMMPF